MSNWIKKGMVSFALATSNVEENMLSQSDEGLGTREGVVNPYRKNQLMNDLKEGKITQEVKEFREHYYKVLKHAEKFKVSWGDGDGEVQVLSESEIKELKNAKGDPYDSYPVEVTVDNRSMSKGVYETSQIRTIKVQRGVVPTNRIEENTDLVLVRDIDGKNKLIEFYIPTSTQNKAVLKEVSTLTSRPGITDFVNITKMYFTTPGGNPLEFEYKMLALDKVVEWNGNYIVKMFAECTKSGIWAAEKYILG